MNAAGPSQSVAVTFTNDANLPAGYYDVTLEVAPSSGESGNPFGKITIELQVNQATVTCTDTTPPNVSITSPTSGTSFGLNSTTPASFNATDPESGCGLNGVDGVSAEITACDNTYTLYSSLPLGTDPSSLPVAEGTTVTATDTSVLLNQIGSFTLTASATAPGTSGELTGSAMETFTVGAAVAPLPPVNISGKVFKSGSTVPIMWQMTDAGGNALSLFSSIQAEITGPNGFDQTVVLSPDNSPEDGINYVLDTTGTVVTQYHTNLKLPAGVSGTYKVTISVNDVCGNEASQGSFTFNVR